MQWSAARCRLHQGPQSSGGQVNHSLRIYIHDVHSAQDSMLMQWHGAKCNSRHGLLRIVPFSPQSVSYPRYRPRHTDAWKWHHSLEFCFHDIVKTQDCQCRLPCVGLQRNASQPRDFCELYHILMVDNHDIVERYGLYDACNGLGQSASYAWDSCKRHYFLKPACIQDIVETHGPLQMASSMSQVSYPRNR